ncbi:MAG: hypothetical protein JJU29_23630 [Verrucomicrobia bacterium]|nr:hypothetical protein [Verrucomicrobiota bacterium]MCH8510355.1 hypothetical protein [Kiritimatiellia bacterium]
MLKYLKQEIQDLGWRGDGFKPHKLIAILTAIHLLKTSTYSSQEVYFDKNYKIIFNELFTKFADTANNSCRPHTPFFHLQSSSFWSLVPLEGMDAALNSTSTVGSAGLLEQLVHHAVVSDFFIEVLRNDQLRTDLINFILKCLTEGKNMKTGAASSFTRLPSQINLQSLENPFVSYLNSLQRSGGGNENALAESQACNPYYPLIQVSHPLAEIIRSELSSSDGCHVILTGHAGDGKSTLALEVYKLLMGFDLNSPLSNPPKDREDLDSISVSIIKDLSERDKNEDEALISEFKSKQRFLLVTNTGTLLDFIKQHPTQFGSDSVTLESDVLDAISSESGESFLIFPDIEFRVFNLALMDSLSLARKVFEKMLAPERWKICEACPYCTTCPIHVNVELIHQNQNMILDRIFLAYRRMYEYGTRLTMRQFTEHLAYLITSGLGDSDVERMHQQSPIPLISEFLFYNRFFGDNGLVADPSAMEMKAVHHIKNQGFGDRPSSHWEHRLWLRSVNTPISLGVDFLKEEFEKMRLHGSHIKQVEGMSADQAREQIRRMLYFLYDFQAEDRNYLGRYLNSPALFEWYDWQTGEENLDFNQKSLLERKIYHVLQEHFTGVRLPEGSTQHDRRLYVTLSRRRNEVRQSAQVVLAQVDWSSSTELKLLPGKNALGDIRRDLVLCGKERIAGIDLPLKVPFLDYVMMRHFGEMGEILEASYLERLDRFKAQVHARAASAEMDRILLVRLKTDHTFRRQHFYVKDNHLEVTDVL